MPRYVAFLRGVSPMNAKMPEVKQAFESAGFTNVRTLLSSGNVAFDARSRSIEALQRKAESAMQATLGRSFLTIVRSSAQLRALVEAEPFAPFELPPGAKRVVTFLPRPCEREIALPLRAGKASVLAVAGTEVLCVYVPEDKGPVFMSLLERQFGKDITTRTLETVQRCAQA